MQNEEKKRGGNKRRGLTLTWTGESNWAWTAASGAWNPKLGFLQSPRVPRKLKKRLARAEAAEFWAADACWTQAQVDSGRLPWSAVAP